MENNQNETNWNDLLKNMRETGEVPSTNGKSPQQIEVEKLCEEFQLKAKALDFHVVTGMCRVNQEEGRLEGAVISSASIPIAMTLAEGIMASTKDQVMKFLLSRGEDNE